MLSFSKALTKGDMNTHRHITASRRWRDWFCAGALVDPILEAGWWFLICSNTLCSNSAADSNVESYNQSIETYRSTILSYDCFRVSTEGSRSGPITNSLG